jgi:hypothetical protein
MGNILSYQSHDEASVESTDDSSVDDGRNAKPVALTTDAFGTFDGSPARWIPFKEKVLGKAGAAGYDAFFKETCRLTKANRNANKRIFYLLKLATTGGGASALVSRHETEQDGHAAWTALKTYYEGPIAAMEAAKMTRTRLFNLRLREKDDATLHMNDFNLYTDQLVKLKRPETEENLVDLFLDSILDPKYEVAKSLCRQLKYTTVAACMEAVRFHNSSTTRDNEADRGETLQNLRTKIRRLQDGRKLETGTPIKGDGAPATGPGAYHSYKDWQALTPEQKKAVLTARGTLRTTRRTKGATPTPTPGTPLTPPADSSPPIP